MLWTLFFAFLKIGAFTFGGGYAMISLLEHECVEKRKWITSEELMELTVIAESTPGPIAINCATYTGYKRAGFWGALAATCGVILPSFIILYAISLFFENLLEIPVIVHAFRGIRCAVALLILQVGVRMIVSHRKNRPTDRFAPAFTALFFLLALGANLAGVSISTVYLILAGGAVGFCLYYLLPRRKRRADP